MITILHICGCCGKQYSAAARLWQALKDAGLPASITSKKGNQCRDLIDKFCIDPNTTLPMVVINNELAVNCKDLTPPYIEKLVKQFKGVSDVDKDNTKPS